MTLETSVSSYTSIKQKPVNSPKFGEFIRLSVNDALHSQKGSLDEGRVFIGRFDKNAEGDTFSPSGQDVSAFYRDHHPLLKKAFDFLNDDHLMGWQMVQLMMRATGVLVATGEDLEAINQLNEQQAADYIFDKTGIVVHQESKVEKDLMARKPAVLAKAESHQNHHAGYVRTWGGDPHKVGTVSGELTIG